MKIDIKDAGKVKILEMSGKLLLGEPERLLHNTVRELSDQGFVNLVFNMKNVTRLDSAGMGEMCAALHHVKSRGGRIHLLLPSDKVLFTIGLVGLRLRFPIFSSEMEAVAAFLEPAPDETWQSERKKDPEAAGTEAAPARAEVAEPAE